MKKIFFFLVMLAFTPSAFAKAKVPALSGRVNDYAQLLSSEDRKRLEEKLTQHERETSNQIVIVTVKSLGGESIEDYTMRVAEAWKIGQKGKDNGVIIVFAKGEDKVRIEIGYGLTGKFTAGMAGEIIRDHIKPSTKQGKYYEGFDHGVDQVFLAVNGAFKGNGQASGSETSMSGKEIAYWVIALIGAFVCAFVSDGMDNDMIGAILGAVIGLVLTWLLYSFLLAFFAMIAGFIIGFIARGVMSAVGDSTGSFDFGSSGGGGGGFSGGGGSFGGDGASG